MKNTAYTHSLPKIAGTAPITPSPLRPTNLTETSITNFVSYKLSSVLIVMKLLYISFAASLIAGVVAGERETESRQGQSNNQPPVNSDVVVGNYMSTLAMVGADSFSMIDSSGGRLLRGSGDARNLQGNGNGNGGCPPGLSTDLQEFPQWKDETGYWIGEYTLLQGDGTYNVNPNWPYPYDSYTGFITGNGMSFSYNDSVSYRRFYSPVAD